MLDRGGGERRAGPDALEAVIHELQGLPVAAAAWELRAAEARALQESRPSNPEFEIEVEEFAGTGDRSGTGAAEISVGLSQEILLAGKLAKRTEVARFAGELAGWDYEAVRLDVLTATAADPESEDEDEGVLALKAARDEAAVELEAAATKLQAMQRGRAAQLARGHGPNAGLDADSLDECAPLSPAERALIDAAVRARGLSARAIQSLRRIARSLADLAGDAAVGVDHLAEALALRGELEPGGAE